MVGSALILHTRILQFIVTCIRSLGPDCFSAQCGTPKIESFPFKLLQIIVRDFLTCFGTTSDTRDAISYLKSVQKMKGEWYNQQGKKNSTEILID